LLNELHVVRLRRLESVKFDSDALWTSGVFSTEPYDDTMLAQPSAWAFVCHHDAFAYREPVATARHHNPRADIRTASHLRRHVSTFRRRQRCQWESGGSM